jgi:hypothetical protein
MAEEESVKVVENTETLSEEQPPPAVEEPAADVAEEKSINPSSPPPAEEQLVAPAAVEKAPEAVEEKSTEGSVKRDVVLARVETEKRNSIIIAWEENEKSRAENKAQKRLSDIQASENSKAASIEASLKKLEEQLEKKKAEYVEKKKNKIALVHKEAEEKRAVVEAKRGEALLKAEETAAKYRATGTTPKKGWF